jgi:hypothetical protein
MTAIKQKTQTSAVRELKKLRTANRKAAAEMSRCCRCCKCCRR